MTVEEMEVTKEDVFETMNSLEKFQEINKDKPTIPDPYLIKGKWLYLEKEKKNTKGEVIDIAHIYITSTPPYVTERYKNVETGEFYYELQFEDEKRKYKLPVLARDITQGKFLVELASKGLEVTQNEAGNLVQYLSFYRRFNKIPDYDVATRLGEIKGHFISPYQEDQQDNRYKIFNSDRGYQALIDAFETKGNIDDYIKGVFNPIKDNPMAMMMFYSSLGSVLLKDFDVDPFVSEISGRTSSGKTFILKICASVWGNRKLVTEWNATNVSVERMASFMNSFPLIKDDTRKADNPFRIPSIVYQFSGGQSKGRGNSDRSIDYLEPWNNIMLSSGEVAIPDIAPDKAGVAGRVITLQDDPFPNTDKTEFGDIAKTMENNHGLLGKLFINQYRTDKDKYKASFEGAVKYFMKQANGNEVMDRIARSFALLQITGEILNDIEGFEHDPYINVNKAHTSMMKNNKNIDKPKQLLEELLEKLNANRGRIAYNKHYYHDNAELMAIYRADFVLIMTPTIKEMLGAEFNSTVKQWDERGYLETNNYGKQKNIRFNGEQQKGYAIKTEIIKELGFDFKKEQQSY
ncbi:DUF927 domain-containing protein [Staphylococcus saprophyticus]|uniref:DUF927 domain-containing protein n=1 Tax=Staphylococcus saprophyticus TaxID=29385 RepID=UPI0010122943|nr:DUF927 domain-containing protein [Staphylococcus saprophyticus]MDL1995602.1 DUF927 domain-containing protein [Staphylococcus saprophyticus]MDW4329831.1 DUF927 domain-containing protein [Staphylococcus saprophyticus]MDW4373663.1 DUF927 domain-containing protein [Staphylococcus saprophyticus]MDW4376284.1 DUF927 domain-containing protein [Staphylococcus saprophyticus]RXS22919.1 DUF927 domain-containing protein [Staphylococcus saprophyticus]